MRLANRHARKWWVLRLLGEYYAQTLHARRFHLFLMYMIEGGHARRGQDGWDGRTIWMLQRKARASISWWRPQSVIQGRNQNDIGVTTRSDTGDDNPFLFTQPFQGNDTEAAPSTNA